MNTRTRSRARFLFGCAAVCGCLLAPAHQTAALALGCVALFAPLQKPMARGGRLLAFTFDGLASWRRLASENQRLRSEIAQLKERLAYEAAQSAEKDERLRTLGEFDRRKQDLVPHDAEVIGEGAGPQRGILFIDRGARDQIERGMAVVAGHSVVGTVRTVGPSVSSVLLVTSPGARFDAEIPATGERGIVVGTGDGTMHMKYISKTEPKPGTPVVTRGRDGVTPSHFLLGLVSEARRRPGSLTYDVILRPARDLERLVTVVAVKPTLSETDFPRNGDDAHD